MFESRVFDTYDSQNTVLMTIKGKWGFLRAYRYGQSPRESMQSLQDM